MSEPIHFEAVDSFTINGRDCVFTGYAPVDSSAERGSDWIGRAALINGATYCIKGVETFALARNVAKGDKIGLLVERSDE